MVGLMGLRGKCWAFRYDIIDFGEGAGLVVKRAPKGLAPWGRGLVVRGLQRCESREES